MNTNETSITIERDPAVTQALAKSRERRQRVEKFAEMARQAIHQLKMTGWLVRVSGGSEAPVAGRRWYCDIRDTSVINTYFQFNGYVVYISVPVAEECLPFFGELMAAVELATGIKPRLGNARTRQYLQQAGLL